MPARKSKIVFMGTPEFARTILQSLLDSGYDVMAVVAQPDRPKGRGQKMQSPPVAELAKERGITLYQPERIPGSTLVEDLANLEPDFLVVAAYGKILSQKVLDIPKIDCLNVHASLLPKFRGAAPINYCLLEGESETGVAIMRMVKELDAGAVYLSESVSIDESDNAITLTEKMANLGGEALIKALDQIEENNLQPIEQNHDQSSYAPKLSRELSPINWSHPARKIFNQVRGLVPWPLATAKLDGKSLKIYETQVEQGQSQGEPGTILHISQQGWTVATGEQQLLIKEVQLEGKKRMNAFDLANGLRLKPGIVLE